MTASLEISAAKDGGGGVNEAPAPQRPRGPNHQDRPTAFQRRQSSHFEFKYIPGFKVRLFSPPKQRQKWGSDQVLPHVNWGDLFFDLFYVAAFFNLGNILVTDPSSIEVLYFVTCFFAILQLWQEKMYYDARFVYGDDLFHKAFEMIYIIVVGVASAAIAGSYRMSHLEKYPDMFGFSLFNAIGTFMNLLRYAENYCFGIGQKKNIRQNSIDNIKWSVGSFLLYLAAAIVSGIEYNMNGEESSEEGYRMLAGGDDCASGNHVPILLVLAGYVSHKLVATIRVVFLFPTDGKHKKFTIPLNIDYCIHRYGELTMLVLGESVLSLLTVDEGKSLSKYLGTLLPGIVTTIGLQFLHFRSLPHDPDLHAMRRSKDAGMLWNQLYMAYSCALLAVGASYKLLLYSIKYDGKEYGRRLAGEEGSACLLPPDVRKQNIATLFSVSLAIVFWTLDGMLVAHLGKMKEIEHAYVECSDRTGAVRKRLNFKGLLLVTLPREAITLFIVTLFLWTSDPNALALLGLGAVYCQLFTRLLGNYLFSIDPNDPCNCNPMDDKQKGLDGCESDDEDDHASEEGEANEAFALGPAL